MKIILCTNSYITDAGGVASYAHDFVDAFAKEYEIVLVTSDAYQQRIDEKCRIIHINGEDISLDNVHLLLNLISTEAPTIVVNSSYPLLSLVTPYLNNDIQVVTISHFMNGKLAWTAGFNADYVDKIVALSTFNKAYLEKKFKISIKEKVSVIYNFMPPLDKIDITEKKKRKILKIVYPGGHSYAKSAEIVCVVVNKLLKTDLPFEFYWLGNIILPGANWPLSRTRLVSDCVNSDDRRIKVFGPVSRDRSKEIIANANIFLLPSRGEGCPITLLEAMRAGCIPIISDAPHGSLDIISNEYSGIVLKQGKTKEIVSKIIDIISNHSKYFYIYNNSHQKFIDSLQYSQWIKQMRSVFGNGNMHKKRKPFSEILLNKDIKQYKRMLRFVWIIDRFFIQPYHVVIFRFIRYTRHIAK